MRERNLNIFRAVIFAIISICCFSMKFLGVAKEGSSFPLIGGTLCAILTILYLKQVFTK